MPAAPRRIIGFDRKIRLGWLDATAEWTAQGLVAPAIREQLDRLLDGQVAGEGPRSARRKTMTVLLHVWTAVPDEVAQLRDDGLVLLRGRGGRDRLPLHWGMCLATYPFFRDVAAATGRLLALQGAAALAQIVRRMAETWGERTTATRAVQRIVRSFVEWGVLMETGNRGTYVPAAKIAVSGVGPWLLEAGLVSSGRREYPLRALAAGAAFYPFDMTLSAPDVSGNPRLEICRQGLDEDVVLLNPKVAAPLAGRRAT